MSALLEMNERCMTDPPTDLRAPSMVSGELGIERGDLGVAIYDSGSQAGLDHGRRRIWDSIDGAVFRPDPAHLN